MSSEVVWRVALASAKSLGWVVESADESHGILKVSVPGGLRSWGESLEVQVEEVSDGRTKITGRSAPKAQLLTWGKTEENLTCFFSALHRRLLANGGD